MALDRLYPPRSARFRRDLLITGITRKALHHGDDRHSPTAFYAIRGAFASGLGNANVDPWTSMRLTSHTSWQVHLRYLAQHAKPMAIPSEAFPSLVSRMTPATTLKVMNDLT